MRQERYINASEIGSYVFCKRAWFLARVQAPSELTAEREAGSAWHESHANQVASASKSKEFARAFATAFVILLLVLLLYRMVAS